MLGEIEKSILATLAYFDIFDYPLTAGEIKKYLFFPGGKPEIDTVDFQKILRTKLGRYIGDDNGFYFLAGREKIVRLRLERYRIALGKLRRAKFFARLLGALPFIRGIFISNNLSYQNSSEASDIDFFIVTAAGRLWTARFFANTFVRLLGLAPKETNKKDKICLNFLVDENNLDIGRYALPGRDGIPDIHYAYWASQFLPLYGTGTAEKFYGANQWVKQYLPNYSPVVPGRDLTVKSGRLGNFFKKIGEKYNLREDFWKKIQYRLMPKDVREMMNKGLEVIVGDDILKLHTNDRRELYREKYIAALGKL